MLLRTFIVTLVLVLQACGGGSDSGSDCDTSNAERCTMPEPEPEPEPAPDTSPDTFSFSPRQDVEPGTVVTSEVVIVTGINTAISVSVVGGEYAVNDGAFTNVTATVENNDSIKIRLTTSTKRNWTDEAVLTIGDYSATFNAVTILPQLGFNLNGAPEDYTGAMKTTIDQLDSEWARGFLDYFFFFDNDPTPGWRLNNSPKLSSIAALKAQGYKTIINIKWNFKNPARSMPAPDGTLIEKYKNNLAELYDRFWENADIIVVGNEPFIESPGDAPSTAYHLVTFYEQMLKATIEYRAASSKPNMPIYLGAFNRLDDSAFQDASNGLLELAKSYQEVEGVDLHIHHLDPGFGEMTRSIEYVLGRIREDQKIISTEFSAMRFLKTHTSDIIDAEFAQEYGINPAWKIHEYINDLLQKHNNGTAITRQQWLDFVTAHPWYDNLQNDYLLNAFNIFMDTAPGQFELATYTARLNFPLKKVFDETTDPWLLNGIIVNRMVQPNADGTFAFNKYLHEDFAGLR